MLSKRRVTELRRTSLKHQYTIHNSSISCPNPDGPPCTCRPVRASIFCYQMLALFVEKLVVERVTKKTDQLPGPAVSSDSKSGVSFIATSKRIFAILSWPHHCSKEAVKIHSEWPRILMYFMYYSLKQKGENYYRLRVPSSLLPLAAEAGSCNLAVCF